MYNFFETILPIIHDIPKHQPHLHTNSPNCQCNPSRYIKGGYNKKTKIKEPFHVLYDHKLLWEPRKIDYPWIINPPKTRKRSKAEDYYDDQDAAMKIQDSYTTISNTSIGLKLLTAKGMGCYTHDD